MDFKFPNWIFLQLSRSILLYLEKLYTTSQDTISAYLNLDKFSTNNSLSSSHSITSPLNIQSIFFNVEYSWCFDTTLVNLDLVKYIPDPPSYNLFLIFFVKNSYKVIFDFSSFVYIKHWKCCIITETHFLTL